MTARAKETAALWVQKILMPILTAFLTIAVGFFGWVGNQVLQDFRDWKRATDNRLQVLELSRASTEASRFSAMDWTRAKASIDASHNTLDTRVTRVEAIIPQINQALDRIEKKLDHLQETR